MPSSRTLASNCLTHYIGLQYCSAIGLAAGFRSYLQTSIDSRDLSSSPEEQNISCEVCHTFPGFIAMMTTSGEIISRYSVLMRLVFTCRRQERCDTHHRLLSDSRGNLVSLSLKSSSDKTENTRDQSGPGCGNSQSSRASSLPRDFVSIDLTPPALSISARSPAFAFLPEGVKCNRLFPTFAGERLFASNRAEKVYWQDPSCDQISHVQPSAIQILQLHPFPLITD